MIVKNQHEDGYWIYFDDAAKGDCRHEVSEQIDAMAWLKEFYPDARKLTFHVPNESDSKPQHRASLQQQGSVAPMASIPARIATIEEVTVLAGATINVAPTDVQPLTANRSMIYQIYSGDALVDAAGNVKTSTAGDIIVKVIPTLASGAARIVTIHVKEAEALTDESGNAITVENETEITC